jgi:hypothetical protein
MNLKDKIPLIFKTSDYKKDKKTFLENFILGQYHTSDHCTLKKVKKNI